LQTLNKSNGVRMTAFGELHCSEFL
jgi:hypothetical protein